MTINQCREKTNLAEQIFIEDASLYTKENKHHVTPVICARSPSQKARYTH
jgi:hypothetical protein